MNKAIELHDSVLDAVVRRGNAVVLMLRPACIHISDGHPGVDDGYTYVQDLVVEIADAGVTGTIGSMPSDILDGDFQFDDVLSPNMIRLPCDSIGTAVLTLYLSPDYREICVVGTGVRITEESAAECVQEFRR